MRRGELRVAQVGNKNRPVLVLTRDAVIDVRQLVTVAEVTTQIRGTSAEVPFEWRDTELTEPSVVNLDGLHTIRQRSLGHALGRLTDPELELVCSALAHALGC